jgi:hypothetical protein
MDVVIGHNNHNKTKHSSSKLQISTSIKIDAKGNIGQSKTLLFQTSNIKKEFEGH